MDLVRSRVGARGQLQLRLPRVLSLCGAARRVICVFIKNSLTNSASLSSGPARGNNEGVIPLHWFWVKFDTSRGP